MHLKKRPEFLKVNAKGRQWVTPAFVLQALPSEKTEDLKSVIRYGITASRKVGGAVERNRAKRRLRALSRFILPLEGHKRMDYVLIARTKVLNHNFLQLCHDLRDTLKKTHEKYDNSSYKNYN